MKPFNWTCPHCEHDVTISEEGYSSRVHFLNIENTTGEHAVRTTFFVCPNPKCGKYTLEAGLWDTGRDKLTNPVISKIREQWRLAPWGKSRTFPDYVPQAIRDDYVEACAIVDLSAKSAATLARRAVQGIVRDYWGTVKDTLNRELQELEKRVGTDITPETWQSIDVVRSVGNIGAHMEKDINVIVDVDPDEAQLLIDLVETLVVDTYIARNARQEHHAELLALKQKKLAEKAGPGGVAPPAAQGA
jgi:hypothetical protein